MTLDEQLLPDLRRIESAIRADDLPLLKQIFKEVPNLLHYVDQDNGNWIAFAARQNKKTIVLWLLEQKVDVNQTVDVGEGKLNALRFAFIALKSDPTAVDIIKLLLQKGCDPNEGRLPLAALKCNKEELRLPLLKLLVKHGCDVNAIYDVYGDKDNVFTALEWAKGDCAEYLRSVGAKTVSELRAAPKAASAPAKPARPQSAAAEVIAYFKQEVGPVSAKSLGEIVSEGGTAISIHVIPSDKGRPFVTLFTTGLSAKAMKAPDEPELKDYVKDFQFAELYIQLPADWKYEQIDDPNWNWPITQLRWLGKYPHGNDTWLGAPATIMSRDPIERLAPNAKFDCLLLLPDKSFQNSAKQTGKLYRLIPLYPEERELEAKSGIGPLMRALDRISTPFIVDLNRKNAGVGTSPKKP